MEKNITITAENMSELVSKAFFECLFKEGEETSDCVKVEGVINTFGFHPQRLEEHREIISAFLSELPTEFHKGSSFLNLCVNKNGKLWTGEHMVCEQLVSMAIGLNLMSYPFPKKMWSILPGGVPYVIVK